MPKYEITSPEGKRFEITAPDGASQEDVLSYAKLQFSPKPSFSDMTLPNKTPATDAEMAQHDRAMFESHPATRFVRGIEAPAIKLGELLGSEDAKSIASAREAGMAMRYEGGNKNDLAGQLGSLATTGYIGGKVMNALSPAGTGFLNAAGRTAAGSVTGGLSAGMQPGSTGEDVASGVAAGGALSGAMEAGKGLYHLGQDLTKDGMIRKYVTEQVGKENLPGVIDALASAQPKIPSSPMQSPRFGPSTPSPVTSAEAVNGMPAGSPIQAMQKQFLEMPGGPSKVGGETLAQSVSARNDAMKNLKAITDPMREQAFAGAEQNGGVKVNGLIKKLGDIQTNKEYAAKDDVKNFVSAIRDKLNEVKDPAWRVSPQALDNIRKDEINAVIAKVQQENPKANTKLLAKIGIEIKQSLDDAMEASGGFGYKDYMKTYSDGMEKIVGEKLSKESMYDPLQKTVLGQRGTQVANELATGGPPLLNRNYAVAKYIPNVIAKRLEPGVDKRLAELIVNAPSMAKVLQPPQPGKYESLANAIAQYGPGVTGSFSRRP